MPYIAHVGILLEENYSAYSKDKWELIQQIGDYKIHRRVSKTSLYELACELFNDREKALVAAKGIYTQAIYNLLKNGIHIVDGGCQFYEKRLIKYDTDSDSDDSFFWTPHDQGGGVGPDVYEVYSSFNEFDEIYNHLNMRADFTVINNSLSLEFRNYDRTPFLYDKESQRLLRTVLQADSVYDRGLQMTLYCGILEHLAPDKDKDVDVIIEIDQLIQHVKESGLSKEKIDSLSSFLNTGKKESSRKKCLDLCGVYAKDSYGQFKTKEIINDAYGLRSAYSHGEDCSNMFSGPASYIKYIVLDVIKGYMNDRGVR